MLEFAHTLVSTDMFFLRMCENQKLSQVLMSEGLEPDALKMCHVVF